MQVLRRKNPGGLELIMKRRDFVGFFLIGGLISLLKRKSPIKKKEQPKEALFWRKAQ